MSKEDIYHGDCARARSHIVDSRFYSSSYATGEARQIFCDKYRYQRWLEIEATLALTQAELGVVPQVAADEIAKNAHLMYLGLHSIQEGIQRTNHSLMPLLWALQKVCKDDTGQYIHYGATTQDIQDTAQVLEIGDAIAIMERDLRVIIGLIMGLMERYKNTLTIGRTHCQHALPITLGLKFSIWADEVYRNLQRLMDCKKRVMGQFLGHDANNLAGLPPLFFYVIPHNLYTAFGGMCQTGHDVYKCRLAGAIGTKEPEKTALIDGKINIAKRLKPAVVFMYLRNCNCRNHKKIPS